MLTIFFISLIIGIYYIWMSLNSFYSFSKFYVKNPKILFSIKKGADSLDDIVIKRFTLLYILMVALFDGGWVLLWASILGFIPVYGIYIFLFIWIVFDAFKFHGVLRLGSYISDQGVFHGVEVYNWDSINHHRWLVKKRPKAETDLLHVFFRKKKRLNPLIIEIYFHDMEKVQNILDKYIENDIREEK